MLCEQATRRGGLENVTDSMWLILAFQTWYVADALYNEVSSEYEPLIRLQNSLFFPLHSACPFHNHGHCDGRFWIHARRR